MGIWILLHWNAESLLLDMRLMPAIICLLVILQWAVLRTFQFTMRSSLCTRLCKMCIIWLCILWLFQFINHCLLYLWVFQSIFIYMEQVDYISETGDMDTATYYMSHVMRWLWSHWWWHHYISTIRVDSHNEHYMWWTSSDKPDF